MSVATAVLVVEILGDGGMFSAHEQFEVEVDQKRVELGFTHGPSQGRRFEVRKDEVVAIDGGAAPTPEEAGRARILTAFVLGAPESVLQVPVDLGGLATGQGRTCEAKGSMRGGAEPGASWTFEYHWSNLPVPEHPGANAIFGPPGCASRADFQLEITGEPEAVVEKGRKLAPGL